MTAGVERWSRRIVPAAAVSLIAAICLLAALPVFASTPEDTGTEHSVYLGEAVKAWWEDDTTARWNSVKKASEYQVRLYEDDEVLVRMTVETVTADFTEYIKAGHRYYYEVRAVARKNQQGYLQDGEWVQSHELMGTDQGDVLGRWKNYREGDQYLKEDGSLADHGWLKIQGGWYFFDQDGYVRHGWLEEADRRYYLDLEDGRMKTGWLELAGSWYFMAPDGAMQTGWLRYKPAEWYYLDADGKLAVSTVIDGYTVDENGLHRKG